MIRSEFEALLRESLKADVPYYAQRPPGLVIPDATEAAVLLLWAWGAEDSSGPSVLLTRRTDLVDSHKGQYAFPGGRMDPDDANPIATALRETHEEVGIPPQAVHVLGELPELYTPTRYRITPIVGILNSRLDELSLRISPEETAEAFWVSMQTLTASGTYRCELFRVGTESWPIHVYQIGERRVWGATGAMLKNFLDRLQSLR